MDQLLDLLTDDMKFSIDSKEHYTTLLQKVMSITNRIHNRTRFAPADTIICHSKMEDIFSKYPTDAFSRFNIITNTEIPQNIILIYSQKTIDHPFIIGEPVINKDNQIPEISFDHILSSKVTKEQIKKYRSGAVGQLEVKGFFKFFD